MNPVVLLYYCRLDSLYLYFTHLQKSGIFGVIVTGAQPGDTCNLASSLVYGSESFTYIKISPNIACSIVSINFDNYLWRKKERKITDSQSH